MHPPPIILHHHQLWCLWHHTFFIVNPRHPTSLCCTLQSWVQEIVSHSRTVSPRLGDNCGLEYSSYNYSIHKTYVTMRGKLSELHWYVLLVSNCGEKVMKKETYGTNPSHSFPSFLNLFPGIGGQPDIKVWFCQFSTHGDICFVFGNLSELNFEA